MSPVHAGPGWEPISLPEELCLCWVLLSEVLRVPLVLQAVRSTGSGWAASRPAPAAMGACATQLMAPAHVRPGGPGSPASQVTLPSTHGPALAR